MIFLIRKTKDDRVADPVMVAEFILNIVIELIVGEMADLKIPAIPQPIGDKNPIIRSNRERVGEMLCSRPQPKGISKRSLMV